MGFTTQDCPVCGKSDAIMGADPQERDAVKWECQRACGKFLMRGWFLTHDWPTVPHEDKEAIATYLKNRKAPRDPQLILSGENYKAYAREGKILLRRAA